MVAETEDLISEQSVKREMIINHYVKDEKQESPDCQTRKQHLKDWSDDTLRIKGEGHAEALSKFQIQLKHLIASQQIFRNSICIEQIRQCAALMQMI